MHVYMHVPWCMPAINTSERWTWIKKYQSTSISRVSLEYALWGSIKSNDEVSFLKIHTLQCTCVVREFINCALLREINIDEFAQLMNSRTTHVWTNELHCTKMRRRQKKNRTCQYSVHGWYFWSSPYSVKLKGLLYRCKEIPLNTHVVWTNELSKCAAGIGHVISVQYMA